MRKVNKKKAAIVALLLFILILLFFLSKGCNKKSEFKYEFRKASRGVVKKTISVTGSLEVIDSHRVLSRVSGIVKKVYFDFNDNVKKGQLLIKIDSPSLDESIIKYRDNLENIRLKLLQAERKLEAAKKMLKENLISKEDVKRAEINYKSLLVSRKHTLMAFNNLLKQKKDTQLRAPVSGIVLSRHVEENTNVRNGTLVFVIAPDLKKMRLLINIDEADIGNVKNGQKVTFSVSAFPKKTFSGEVIQVRMNPIKQRGLVTYEALVDCNNDDLMLKPGMTATASILVAEKKDVLRVLNQALLISPEKVQYSPGKKYVWVKDSLSMKSPPVKRVEVETGLVGDMYTEIISNLKIGDKVLTKLFRKKD